MTQIKQGFILAAGRGKRMQHLTDDKPKPRRVQPWQLIFDNGNWNLHALDVAKNARRRYTLSEIKNLTLTKDVFTLPKDYDFRKMTRGSFGCLCDKNYENYNFMDSSSGETNLLCQFIGILSTIQDNSLIIIDEPENSSHPNWQINYIGWLKDIFKEYHSCHFVIATHSHFILTDLQEHYSTIIALEKADGRVKNIAENLNTFCWSVDDILYNVFHVRNTRNSVFENKMMRLYKLVTENNADREGINRLLDELERYKLTDDDPLNKLINLAKNKNA